MTTQQQTNLQALLGRVQGNTLTSADQQVIGGVLSSIIASWGFGGTGAPPDLLAYGGQSDESNARAWFAILYEMAQSISGGTPVIPTSWTVPNWFIDPVNGSDLNNGTSAGTPLKTYAQLVNLWGTTSPRLRQTTTITFLSSHPDNTDPVYLTPHLENGASCILQGTAPTVIAAGVVLAGVTSKNTAVGTNSLLIATLGGSGAALQMVQNTTAAKSSRAWAYKSLGAGSFSLTQPLVPFVPPAITAPLEVDTWANGDTVNLLAPIAINVVQVGATSADPNLLTASVYVYQCTIFDPSGTGQRCYVSEQVQLCEATSQRAIVTSGSTRQLHHTNVFLQKGGTIEAPAQSFIGGATLAAVQCSQADPMSLDGDFIAGGAINFFSGGQLGRVFFDANINVQSGLLTVAPIFYAASVLYGSGANTLNMNGNSHCAQTAGTFVATFTAPGLVTGVKLNGSATGSSHTGASPDVLNSAIATSPANLDAAAGVAGFGGNAFKVGGASCATT